MVKEAREFSAFTQTDLARRIGVDQSTIHYIESGRREPSPDILKAIARETNFPDDFFEQDVFGEQFPLGSLLLFRARASLTARQEAQAHTCSKIVYRVLRTLLARVTKIPLKLPQMSEPPSIAAEITRTNWGLSPSAPLMDLTRTIERAGVTIIALPLTLPTIDAFSMWVGMHPVIAVLQGKPNDRLRFSIAHELGHLVMHQTMRGDVEGVEMEATQFAGELLLPELAMRAELRTPLTLTTLARLKVQWRVSIQMLIMRAHELGLTTARQKTYLFQQLSAKGWRKNEPLSEQIPDERPRALRQIVESLYGDPVDVAAFAKDVHVSRSLAKAIVEAHAPRHSPADSNIIRYPEFRPVSQV